VPFHRCSTSRVLREKRGCGGAIIPRFSPRRGEATGIHGLPHVRRWRTLHSERRMCGKILLGTAFPVHLETWSRGFHRVVRLGKTPNEHPWQSQKHCARLPIRSQGFSGLGRSLRGWVRRGPSRENREAPFFRAGSRHFSKSSVLVLTQLIVDHFPLLTPAVARPVLSGRGLWARRKRPRFCTMCRCCRKAGSSWESGGEDEAKGLPAAFFWGIEGQGGVESTIYGPAWWDRGFCG
jgi:hypothetical protein